MRDDNDDQIRDEEQFGSELRRRLGYILRIRGTSPAELARDAGLPSANLLYNFFSGRSKSLHLFTTRQICKALGVSMGELLDDHWWDGRPRTRSSGQVRKRCRAVAMPGSDEGDKASIAT